MTLLPLHKQSAAGAARWAKVAACAAIALASLVAYRNSFSTPFQFDDRGSILDNATIRSLRPIGRVLSPPDTGGQTVGGRPVLNFSLAVNHAIGGTRVEGYHALNLLIHILAGLTLFGIVRRTLERARHAPAIFPAFAIALLWTLHPLQTESVTYVIQRAESLMGLFYLLTLYCFVRSTWVPRLRSGRAWAVLSVLACLLGMATKEVMISAPAIVFLYDRTFVAGNFRGAWKARRGYYVALGSTCLLLAWLVAGTGGNRGGTSGFGLGIPWGAYLLTQGPAILHYLGLVFWPHPLVFYYTARWVHGFSAWSDATIVVLLLAATGYALWRSMALGFLGAWFFAILAPTSLVPGPAETMAEHRMYLPLAAVLAILICAIHAAAGRMLQGEDRAGGDPSKPWLRRALLYGAALLACCAAAFAAMTVQRNRVYQSDLALWTDTVRECPDNPYAQNNLGVALTHAGRLTEAYDCLIRAVRLKPDFADACTNLGNVLRAEGRTGEAAAEFEKALRYKPDDAEAYNNLGNVLRAEGRTGEAMADFEKALRYKPDYAEAFNGLGTALTDSRRLPEAIAAFSQALRIDPQYAQAQYNLGNALADADRIPEAIARYEEALRLDPDMVEARLNLGTAYVLTGRYREAEAQYEAALRARPDYAPARDNLARLRTLEMSTPRQP